jgi:methionine-rich copper-binding protein CopC
MARQGRRRGLALVLLAAACLGGEARAGWAHAFPERAEPRVGSVVQTPPPVVRIWFDGALEPRFSQLRVVDGGGRRVDRGDARVDAIDRHLLQVTLPPLGPGIYKVEWAVLSIDGHRTSGDYRFTVKSVE